MKKTFTKLLTVIVLILLTTGAMAQTTWYVNKNNLTPGNGKDSWSVAFTDLQAALEVAAAGDQIWVAKGVYKPSVRPGIILGSDRHFSFDIPAGISVYGGFVGTESAVSERAFHLVNDKPMLVNETILSGDIGVEEDDTDNVYHVVVIVEREGTIVLDGFTIQDGRAVIAANTAATLRTAEIRVYYGGGIFVSNANAELKNIIVKNNKAARTNNSTGVLTYGGGMFVRGGVNKTIIIENAIFENNEVYNAGTATDPTAYGGAIYFGGDAIIANLKNITFKGNSAYFTQSTSTTSHGGAMHIASNSTINMNNVSFLDNITTVGGGGALSVLGSEANPSIVNIIGGKFVRNKGAVGGAMRVSTAATVNIDGTLFTDNRSTGSHGGAIYGLTATSTINVKNSRFFKNESAQSGAAIYRTAAGTLKLDNSLIAENTASTTGGGVTIDVGTATITGCTFYSNKALTTSADGGGALRLSSSTANVSLYNSIMYANTHGTSDAQPDISKGSAATLDLRNTITQLYSTGTNLYVGAEPLFLSTTMLNGDDLNTDFLKLAPITGNPAIDAGDNNLVPKVYNDDIPPVDITLTHATDLAGALRFNGTVDLGTYENHTPLPVKLADFSAKANTNSIVVSWATETETNNSHFILERSADGVNFVTIATPASKGNGAKYSHADFSPVNGINYYRLTQVDNDGTKVTYDPIVVNFSLKANEVSVYPNPAVGNKITVSLAGQKYTSLQLINLNGQKLQSLTISASETEKTIDISAYPSGTYFILLSNGVNITTKKVIKP